MQGQHQEGSAATGFDDDRHELGVDRTERAIPGDAGNPDVVVTLVIFHGLAKHVPKFALSYHSPHGVCGGKSKKVRRTRPAGCTWTGLFFLPAIPLAILASTHEHQPSSTRCRRCSGSRLSLLSLHMFMLYPLILQTGLTADGFKALYKASNPRSLVSSTTECFQAIPRSTSKAARLIFCRQPSPPSTHRHHVHLSTARAAPSSACPSKEKMPTFENGLRRVKEWGKLPGF